MANTVTGAVLLHPRILTRGFAAGVPPWYALPMGDTRALILTIIGTGLAVVTIVVTVLSMQIASVNTRIDDVRNDLRDFRTEVNASGFVLAVLGEGTAGTVALDLQRTR